jgi:hypothetical protein
MYRTRQSGSSRSDRPDVGERKPEVRVPEEVVSWPDSRMALEFDQGTRSVSKPRYNFGDLLDNENVLQYRLRAVIESPHQRRSEESLFCRKLP